jgi:hypothetical protein
VVHTNSTGCRFKKPGFLILTLVALSACNGSSSDDNNAPTNPGVVNEIGSTCHSSNASKSCLALKTVQYTQNGVAVSNASTALANLQVMNTIWAPCNISYMIEDFEQLDPSQYGLPFNPSNTTDMDSIRQAFQNTNQFLQVTTGTWNRSGTLGQNTANAWTAMPGGYPVGSVFEQPVAYFGNIYAHEVGHYLDLYHVPDTTDVMNATIYYSSTILTSDQCSTAQAAIQQYWSAMLR